MKFLVDRCAGGRLAAFLREQGHDVGENADPAPDPGDRALLEIAAKEGRILITIDTDFGALVHIEGRAHAGLVRLPDVPAARRIEIMRQLLATHAADLETAAIITVRGGRIRVSRVPR